MSLVLRNVIATFVGTAWIGVMNAVLAPYVVHHLGVEAYGLLGVFLALQGLVMPLGTGVSSVLTREVARLRAADDASGERELVNTAEVLYLAAALLIAIVIVAVAPRVGDEWLHPAALSHDAVIRALRYIAIAAAVQLPITGYTAVLMGLQRHVAANSVSTVAVSLRVVIAIVLCYAAPTTDWFFAWQAIAAVAHAIALRAAMRHLLPDASVKIFDAIRVAPLARFTRGVFIGTMLGTLLAQIDKIVLARVVPLADFGRYTLAVTLASATGAIVSAVSLAFFPRFAAAIRRDDENDLKVSYHRASQLVAVSLVPLALVIAAFGTEVLRAWTGDAGAAAAMGPVVAMLVLGAMFNGLVAVPYAVQIASGWAELAVRLNVVAVVLVVPAMIAGARFAGGRGTAAVWLALNACYLFIGVPLMYRRLLSTEQKPWWRSDVLVPSATALVVVAAFRWLLPVAESRVIAAFELAAITIVAAGAAALFAPLIRGGLLQKS